jgi:hypothetical protein
MTALQARINAFEALASQNQAPHPRSKAKADITHEQKAGLPPPLPARKPSLIDLKDWVVDDPPTVEQPRVVPYKEYRRKPLPAAVASPTPSQSSGVLINVESPPAQPPRLPPRKPSHNSLKAVSDMGSGRGDTLTADRFSYTYPPNLRNLHMPASSVSSFHSVSLSSDAGADVEDAEREPDRDSLAESFENVSYPSPVREMPSQQLRKPPPPLPQRPAIVPTPTGSSSSSTSTSRRKGPPPPPLHNPVLISPRASVVSSPRTSIMSMSDRASLLSSVTSMSGQSHDINKTIVLTPIPKHARPTPVPAAARKRFENVFLTNLRALRISSESAPKSKRVTSPPPGSSRGWRGLSVDLITDMDHPAHVTSASSSASDSDDNTGHQDRLPGHVVRRIWSASKLEKNVLHQIWYVAQ